MEKRKRSRKRIKQSEDVPVELIHRIQSLLPVKQAAGTCVLSKSWLHAWSTIPIVRFPIHRSLQKSEINRILERYHENNIPIESFDLQFDIRNHELAFLVEKWIRLVAFKSSCLKELSLRIRVVGIDCFALPHEILFSSKNLKTINVSSFDPLRINSICLRNNLVINCVSLSILKLEDVNMNDEILDHILSTCSLLEKIKLFRCKGLTKIKVKNLSRLRELELFSLDSDEVLEIGSVPSLRFFHYDSIYYKYLPFNTKSLGGVTQLHIAGVIIHDAFLDIINSNFPFLQSLTLATDFIWGLGECNCLVITSVSLKMFSLKLSMISQIHIKVYAPNLLSFFYNGKRRPNSLLFQTVAPKEINITVLGRACSFPFDQQA